MTKEDRGKLTLQIVDIRSILQDILILHSWWSTSAEGNFSFFQLLPHLFILKRLILNEIIIGRDKSKLTVSTSFLTFSSSDDEPGRARSTSAMVCCEKSSACGRTGPACELDRFGVPELLLLPLPASAPSSPFSRSTSTKPASWKIFCPSGSILTHYRPIRVIYESSYWRT